MHDTPYIFHGLHLEYIINGHQSARRKVSITGSSISNGKLFTQLENMPRLDGNSVRYLSSTDTKRMVSESTLNILASVTTDSNYVDTGDEVSVTNLLERILKRDEVSAANFEDKKWDSVFWDPNFARPDKITNYLNKALKRNESDMEHFYMTDAARTSSKKGNANFELFKKFKLGGGGGSESTTKEKVEVKAILKTLEVEDTQVEYSGEVFKVKPMRLYRLNLATLKSSASLAVASVQVHRYVLSCCCDSGLFNQNPFICRYESVQTIPVRVTDGNYFAPNGTSSSTNSSSPSTPISSSLTPQLVQARLQAELKVVRDQVKALEASLASKEAALRRTISSRESSIMSSMNAVDGRLSGRIGQAEGKLNRMPHGGI